ncbi:hypothetical protein [uncultured Oscillibacter sp.]|uniref:hypothetical protein n=1 Tax=uncultured Oscillibacter sp. TaxID=876091 RepID=UPI0028064D47|nr:hypothetical protein [uncultured Oscillibacter sp.]
MPFSLGHLGALLLALVVLFVVGCLWYALVETVKDALARRLFPRKEEPWHPLPPEEKEPRD